MTSQRRGACAAWPSKQTAAGPVSVRPCSRQPSRPSETTVRHCSGAGRAKLRKASTRGTASSAPAICSRSPSPGRTATCASRSIVDRLPLVFRTEGPLHSAFRGEEDGEEQGHEGCPAPDADDQRLLGHAEVDVPVEEVVVPAKQPE